MGLELINLTLWFGSVGLLLGVWEGEGEGEGEESGREGWLACVAFVEGVVLVLRAGRGKKEDGVCVSVCFGRREIN